VYGRSLTRPRAALPGVAFAFTISAGRITEINLIANTGHLRDLRLTILDG
jgi:hypothetical protein